MCLFLSQPLFCGSMDNYGDDDQTEFVNLADMESQRELSESKIIR